MQHLNSSASKPSLFDKLTREEPRPRYRHPSYDATQPRIDRHPITEDTRALVKDAEVIATLAKEIDGTPEHVTLSQLRMQAMENNPALQPAARFESSAATTITLLDGIRARCSEVGDLLDDGGREPHKVNVRQMLITLRHCEAELGHLVDSLAASLGLVEVR